MMFIAVMEGVSNETNLLKRSAVKNRMIPETKQIKICGSTAAERKQKILTRLPSKQQLRWLWTRKPVDYRESTCMNLSVSCPYEINCPFWS